MGLFSSSAAMWLVIAAFIAGLVIMWKVRDLLGWLFGNTPIVRYHTLVSAIHKVNELVAVRSYFQEVIDYTHPTSVISNSRILMVVQGEIVCRFDMSKARINVREEDKRAYITMPECEFKDHVEARESYVYDATRGVFDFVADIFRSDDRFDPNDVARIIKLKMPEHIEKIKAKMKLADKAKENAREALENLTATFGYTSTISFSD